MVGGYSGMEDESTLVLTDSALLALYSVEGDQLAFAELVNRYQPMVLRVCRQVLAGCQQAEDASQQVFVTLSMKAAGLLDRESVASWLYRAAWNISNRTRRAACVRKAHEKSAASRMPMYAPLERTEPDTMLVLHEALAEIPDIYREAIVLHYFCGHSVTESAAKLRCPAGTVAARVSRGLERMRAILSDRSLVLSALGIKLLMMGILSGSKAAAASPTAAAGSVAVPPLHFPRPGRGMFRVRILRAAQAAGLLPAGFAFRASGGTFPWNTFGATAGAFATQFGAIQANPWLLLKHFSAQAKWKQALTCLVLVFSTMGAGSAAARVVAPNSWLAKLPDIITTSVASTAVQASGAGAPSADSKPSSSEHNGIFGPSAQSAVPEPSSVSLLLIGATVALRRHRHR
jgi:RNA polymerase sigma factor (sigma-70 family)